MEDNNGLDALDGIVDELFFDDRILEENLGILAHLEPPINWGNFVMFLAYLTVHLEDRTGGNFPWRITNLQPSKIQKNRRICVTILDVRRACTITFQLEIISGEEIGEICYLSTVEKAITYQNALHANKIVEVNVAENVNGNVFCYLKTANCRQPSGCAKYKLSVFCTINNQRTLLHSFAVIPIRNHKWESGKAGQLQNNNNCTVATVPVYYY